MQEPGQASGRDYSEDFGSWFAPRHFGCRVCDLELDDEELPLANIGNEFLDGWDREHDLDESEMYPGPDDYDVDEPPDDD